MSIEERLTHFLLAKKAIGANRQDLAHRLPSLMASLRPLLQTHLKHSDYSQSDTSLHERLQALTVGLAPRMAAARHLGSGVNVWQMAGLKRAEVRNTAALAALWSPTQIGDHASIFLNAFLRRIDQSQTLPSAHELAGHYVVRTEHCATGAVSERVDITIESQSFVLGIEVKIDAVEGPQQLQRYRHSVEDWARQRGKRGAVIYLAPVQTKVDGIINADWRDVIHAARSMLPSKQSDFLFAHRLIHDFACHALAFQGVKR